MATHRIPILGWATMPDTSGEVFPESYDVLATNDVWDRTIYRFGSSNVAEPTARMGLHAGFTVPKNYVGVPKIVVIWTATPITGNVVWDFDYRTVAGNDTTSLDQVGTEETVTVTDAAPGAAHRRLEALLTLTAANFAVDDEVECTLFRDGADAADTMAGSAILFQLLFEYTDA